MKKAKAAGRSRLRSPSKRGTARFQQGEVGVAPVSLSGYVRQVRRALNGRPDDYREFVDIAPRYRSALAEN